MVLIVILSLGTLAAIASGMRQRYQGPLDENDWYALWNFTELYVGIIAACAPALKPLFRRFFDAVGKLTNAPGGTGQDGVPLEDFGNKTLAFAEERGASEEHILPSSATRIYVTKEVEIQGTQYLQSLGGKRM